MSRSLIWRSFLLLLPRGVLSGAPADCQPYVLDAQRHYQLWLDITAGYHWRADAASSAHSCDSRPEADIHLDDYESARSPPPHIQRHASAGRRSSDGCPFSQTLVFRNGDAPPTFEEEFDEGPFLRMLFKLLSTMPEQPYQVNLHLTSIVSKLALLPHPELHEYLLSPGLATAHGTRTLFKTLQELARRLAAEVPRIKNFKAAIESTRAQLMSEDPAYDDIGDHNQLVESLIVLEEFCKELAAIAFVKYQHAARR